MDCCGSAGLVSVFRGLPLSAVLALALLGYPSHAQLCCTSGVCCPFRFLELIPAGWLAAMFLSLQGCGLSFCSSRVSVCCAQVASVWRWLVSLAFDILLSAFSVSKFENALRVFPAETRLTVYRRLEISRTRGVHEEVR